MKLFKYFLIFISLFLSSFLLFIYFNNHKTVFNPISIKNDFYQKLDLAIKTSQIETSSVVVRDFNHEVEFYLNHDNQSVKIILSDQKDPFSQISSLQELLKTARINQQKLKLVNLSSTHPYATFKNN